MGRHRRGHVDSATICTRANGWARTSPSGWPLRDLDGRRLNMGRRDGSQPYPTSFRSIAVRLAEEEKWTLEWTHAIQHRLHRSPFEDALTPLLKELPAITVKLWLP